MGRPLDLTALLQTAATANDLASRHLWMVRLMQWLRRHPKSARAASTRSTPPTPPESASPTTSTGATDVNGAATLAKLHHLLAVLDADPAHRREVQTLFADFWRSVDTTALLADHGFGRRMSLRSEWTERVVQRVLPATPQTNDLGALFDLFFEADDDRWIAAIDEATMQRLVQLVGPPESTASALEPSMAALANAIAATGLSSALRRRMDEERLASNPFHQLPLVVARLRDARHAGEQAGAAREATYLRALLDSCRRATDSVREHLDEHGVSVDIVFECDQLQARIVRLEHLLDLAMSPTPATEVRELVVRLLHEVTQQRSLRALLQRHNQQLARRMVERHAEAGEHYITRTRDEHRQMLRRAMGGGALVGVTVLAKVGIGLLPLLPFWEGMANGLLYALSFVAIMLMHATLATKQPAMTAPALAAQLRETGTAAGLDAFVDRVAQLIRSQVAGVVGNLAAVVPVVLLVQLAARLLMGEPLASAAATAKVFDSLHLLGPALFFAAFTGVLLFASSLIAGWAENWFVFRQLESAITWNPRIVGWLGPQRAQRWARWWREHISGLAGNVSLGLMLGLVPVLLHFVGIGLEARHVTLSMGQVAAAVGARDLDVLRDPALWWAVASIPFIGVLNLSVSFGLAFTLAMRAGGIRLNDRQRIYGAIRRGFWRDPMKFLWARRRDDPSLAPSDFRGDDLRRDPRRDPLGDQSLPPPPSPPPPPPLAPPSPSAPPTSPTSRPSGDPSVR